MKPPLSCLALAVILAVTSLAASTQAVIPFDFKAGDTSLTAGIYRIDVSPLNGLVTLTGRSGRAMVVMARPGKSTLGLERSRLVFLRQAHGYALSEVQFAGQPAASRLPVTGPFAFQVALVTE
jgi:hypothetical protein